MGTVASFIFCILCLFYIFDVLLLFSEKLRDNIIIKIVLIVCCFYIVCFVSSFSDDISNYLIHRFSVFGDFMNCIAENNKKMIYVITFIVLAIVCALLTEESEVEFKEKGGKNFEIIEMSIPFSFVALFVLSILCFHIINIYFLIFGMFSLPFIIKKRDKDLIISSIFLGASFAMLIMVIIFMLCIATFFVFIYLLPSGGEGGVATITANDNDTNTNDDVTDTKEEHWYDRRAIVRDSDGNEYKRGRSGDYVENSKGKWIRVYRDSNGDPYFVDDSEKKWLE